MKFVIFAVFVILSACPLLQGAEHSIERIILLSDVDGVIRESVEDQELSQEMQEAIESLLNTQKVEIAFISGSPCVKTPVSYPWQEDNISLFEIFYSPFKKWIENGTVTVYGAQGGQSLTCAGDCEIDEEVLFTDFEKEGFYSSFIGAYCKGASYSFPEKEWVAAAREIYNIDKGFRLIDRGCEMEMQATLSGWSIERARDYFAKTVPAAMISSGIAHRGNDPFFFLKVSRMSKEIGANKYLRSKKINEISPGTLIVAFGDTQVDVGLYKIARKFEGMAFHFGKEGSYEGSPLIVRSEDGCDSTHTQGAIKTLNFLQKLVTKD